VICALGVLALLAAELSGHRTWPVVCLQTLLIVGILVTSALDLWDLGRRPATGSLHPE